MKMLVVNNDCCRWNSSMSAAPVVAVSLGVGGGWLLHMKLKNKNRYFINSFYSNRLLPELYYMYIHCSCSLLDSEMWFMTPLSSWT